MRATLPGHLASERDLTLADGDTTTLQLTLTREPPPPPRGRLMLALGVPLAILGVALLAHALAYDPAAGLDVDGALAARIVAFDVLILWACGRIFRLAILRTGQPPRILELFRWLRNR